MSARPASRFNPTVFAALWNNHSVPTMRIAEVMGLSRQGVSFHAKRLGLPGRDKVRKRMFDPGLLSEMWLANVAAKEIADHFGLTSHSCVITAAKRLGLPGRKRGKSGTMNGGWEPNITAREFFLDRAQGTLARFMARAAQVEQAAMINAELVDRVSGNNWVGIRQARGVA